MTRVASLSGALPSGEANGIAAIVRDLVDDPERVHVLVVLADSLKTTKMTDDGSIVPTLRIRRVEAISDPADRASLQRLLMREFERRTGQPVLPLELENDVRAAFGDTSPEHGPGPEPPAGEDPPPKPPRGRKA